MAGFVERFAAALNEAGFPRMPARVFACLLATDSGRLTATELAIRLKVSAAAISGAVRYLVQVNLASREREPGSRRDLYRVHDDVWYEAIARRDQMLARLESRLRDGLEVLGRDTPAGARMAETLAFFEFLQTALPELLDRWRDQKNETRERLSRERRVPRGAAGVPVTAHPGVDRSARGLRNRTANASAANRT